MAKDFAFKPSFSDMQTGSHLGSGEDTHGNTIRVHASHWYD